MTDGGFIMVPRCIFEDPLLQNDAHFHAWLRLVSEAAWKPRRITVTNGRTSEIVELGRGQLSHSRRYLAKSWGWTEKRVRTFLSRLKKIGLIDLQAGRLQTVITISNYDLYQSTRNDEGPQTGQQRAGKGPEEEETREGNNRYSARNLGENPKAWPEDGFVRWYALYPRKRDRAAAKKAFANAQARGLIDFDELLAVTKRFAESVRDKEPEFIKYPATWLNAESYLDEPDKPKGAAGNPAFAEPSRGPESFSDLDWKDRLRNHREKGEWSNYWGPRPGEPGCKVPAHLLNGGGHG